MRNVLLIAGIVGCLIWPLGVFPAVADDTRPPNIVLIFMDDMGYGDVNPVTTTPYKTPNLDQLALRGRVFEQFVVPSAVCSASRASLLTGCLNRRVSVSGAYGPKSDRGLNPDETTLAEVCRSAGYATACFGKWHLGHHPKFLPTNQGFDHFYGIPYSNDMWPLHPAAVAKRRSDPDAESLYPSLPMIRSTPGNVAIVNDDVSPDDQRQMTGELTRRGVRFIQDNVDRPFFLYLPYPMVHVPLYASAEFDGKSGLGLFADVMLEIDHSVGQIVGAIDGANLAEQTLIIFTSDNGPWLSYGTHAGSAGPLREGKGTMFEGGVREPTIMRWTGRIPPATRTRTLCSSIDLLPTIARWIGAELPDRKIDGLDIAPVVLNEPVPPELADRVLPGYFAGGQLQTIRDQQFKLVFDHRYRTLAGKPGGDFGRPVAYRHRQSGRCLYDLASDPAESNNVIQSHPDVAERLSAAADRYRSELGDKLRGVVGNQVRPSGAMQPGDERLPLVW